MPGFGFLIAGSKWSNGFCRVDYRVGKIELDIFRMPPDSMRNTPSPFLKRLSILTCEPAITEFRIVIEPGGFRMNCIDTGFTFVFGVCSLIGTSCLDVQVF